MRAVTLHLGAVQDPAVRAALEEIAKASQENVINDVANSGSVLSTIKDAAANTVPYFVSASAVDVTSLTAFTRTLLALTTAAAWLSALGGSPSGSYLVSTNNLSDLGNTGTARTNLGLDPAHAIATLGLGSAAALASSAILQAANNLSDVGNSATARTNLGLGTAATKDVGTSANQVVQLDASGKLPAVDGSALTNLPSTGRLVAGTPLVSSPMTSSAVVTQAHGLGVAPTYVLAYLECLTAEFGYAIGDRLLVGSLTNSFFAIEIDATNVYYIAQTNPQVARKDTFATGSLTLANWKLVATPYKLT